MCLNTGKEKMYETFCTYRKPLRRWRDVRIFVDIYQTVVGSGGLHRGALSWCSGRLNVLRLVVLCVLPVLYHQSLISVRTKDKPLSRSYIPRRTLGRNSLQERFTARGPEWTRSSSALHRCVLNMCPWFLVLFLYSFCCCYNACISAMWHFNSVYSSPSIKTGLAFICV